MHACIYTAIYGGYDTLREQMAQTIPTDFICFTDSPDVSPAKPWSVVSNHDRPNLHPRMRAKYFKILSHIVFPDGAVDRSLVPSDFPARTYDYLIWIDGSIQLVRPDFVEMIVSHMPEGGWTMLKHPQRDCIYDEAAESLRYYPNKYGHLPIIEQVESYRAEGYPEHNGLMACTVIGRTSKDRSLDRVNDMWWHENLRWSYQDQLSLPYVLWKLNMTYAPIDLVLGQNEYFRWISRERND